ncbi:MAG: MBL fold metallo-hydrolase [Clostridia bacterium]|nr:MBL fold metallo-hydrolase [Clostridia bacterium]
MRVSTYVTGMLFTNCYFVQDEGTGKTVMIDPGNFTDEMKGHIDRIGKENIEYILLTHCHFDHTLGAIAAQEYTGAPIAIYEGDAAGLSDQVGAGLQSFWMSAPQLPAADVTFADGECIEIGDTTIRVMHTPGHTAGSCCFICEDCIFSGDTLFFESCGRTDLPTGSPKDMLASLIKLSEIPGEYSVYPGHGEKTTLSHERKNNPYMVQK